MHHKKPEPIICQDTCVLLVFAFKTFYLSESKMTAPPPKNEKRQDRNAASSIAPHPALVTELQQQPSSGHISIQSSSKLELIM
jgi:hypothetical protein